MKYKTINNKKPVAQSLFNSKNPGDSSSMLKFQLEIQEMSWKLGSFPKSAVGNMKCPDHVWGNCLFAEPCLYITVRAVERYIASTITTISPLKQASPESISQLTITKILYTIL